MKTAEEIFAKYELKDQNGEGTDCLWYDDALLAMEEYAEQQVKLLATPDVSGSALLPDGWKVYKCTDCKEISVKKDNGEITVGFCDNCEHPLWND